MLRFFFLIVIFFSLHPVLFSQVIPHYPKFYFQNPLGIPMDIISNYGELRPEHWHMGLDIRTRKKENYPVYAAASGYIARIKIEKFGYGRSIYINHPNGMTTVYGHLNNFFPALEKYVTEQQYKKQSWEIELNFDKKQFPVFKSQLIAYSGTTGNSQGPHLHFEIRDTKTGKCLNPLLFGFPVKDAEPPQLIRLGLYDRSRSVYDQPPQLFILKKTDSGYIVDDDAILQTGFKRISFAIQAIDRMKKTGSADGIYSAKIFFDNKPLIAFVLDSMDYNETAYINAQIDYKLHYNSGEYLQHLSQLPGDHGVVYKKINNDGIIDLSDTNVHFVTIEVKDAYQNSSRFNFKVQYEDSLARFDTQNISSQRFVPNQMNSFKKPDFEIFFPEKSFYDTVSVLYLRNEYFLPNAVSILHQLNDPSIPVHENFTVRIRPNIEIPQQWENKIVMKRHDPRSSTVRKAEWQKDTLNNIQWLTAKFGELGSFQAFVDTVPPQIKIFENGDTLDLSREKRIVIEPVDNFGVIKNFHAEIDDRWIRFTNDKGRSFIYIFDERCSYGIHKLTIRAEDLVGNSITKTYWFKRYPYTPPKKKVVRKGKKHKGQSIRKKIRKG